MLHGRLDQPDREEGGEAEDGGEENGVAQMTVVEERLAADPQRLGQVGMGQGRMVDRGFLEGAADEQRQQPDADLGEEGEQGGGGVHEAGAEGAAGFAELGGAGHAPVVAGVVFFLPGLFEGLEEQGAVRAADEGEGDAEQQFGDEHPGEALGLGVDPPADNADERGEIEGETVAEAVAEISRRIFHEQRRHREEPLQKEDLGEGEADVILPEEGDDRHREEGHLEEGEGVEPADVAQGARRRGAQSRQ